jgi:hypothetical protein
MKYCSDRLYPSGVYERCCFLDFIDSSAREGGQNNCRCHMVMGSGQVQDVVRCGFGFRQCSFFLSLRSCPSSRTASLTSYSHVLIRIESGCLLGSAARKGPVPGVPDVHCHLRAVTQRNARAPVLGSLSWAYLKLTVLFRSFVLRSVFVLEVPSGLS